LSLQRKHPGSAHGTEFFCLDADGRGVRVGGIDDVDDRRTLLALSEEEPASDQPAVGGVLRSLNWIHSGLRLDRLPVRPGDREADGVTERGAIEHALDPAPEREELRAPRLRPQQLLEEAPDLPDEPLPLIAAVALLQAAIPA